MRRKKLTRLPSTVWTLQSTISRQSESWTLREVVNPLLEIPGVQSPSRNPGIKTWLLARIHGAIVSRRRLHQKIQAEFPTVLLLLFDKC